MAKKEVVTDLWVYELLKEANVDANSKLGQELIEKYEKALKTKQEELKELETKILSMAENDFLKSIKGE